MTTPDDEKVQREKVSDWKPSTSSSGTPNKCTLGGWLAPYEHLDLLTPVMKKYISDQIKKKILSKGYSLNEITSWSYPKFSTFIKPYIRFNSYLRNVQDKVELWDLMKLLFFQPTTIKHLCLDFPTKNMRETKSLEQRARRLAEKMKQAGILTSIIVGSGLYGIAYNSRLRNCKIYYVTGLHTQEEIEYEISRYGEYALLIGLPKDRIKPEDKKPVDIEKLKEQIVTKKTKQALEAVFDQTEDGQQITQALQQNKSKKQLDTKATKHKVLITPKEKQSKNIQELLIPIIDKIGISSPKKLLEEENVLELKETNNCVCIKCEREILDQEYFSTEKGIYCEKCYRLFVK